MRGYKHFVTAFVAVVLMASPAWAEDPPPDPATQAAALQKLQGEARKANADADKAETDAAAAKRDLQLKVLPNSGKGSTITAKDTAGQVEAALLANRELTGLTAEVATQANALFQLGCQGTACPRRKVVVLSATEDLQLPHRAIYDLRKTIVRRALENAIKSFDTTPPPKKGTKAAGFIGAGAAASVVQLANLASYFATSTEVGGISVTPNDQAMYGALVENLRRVCGLNDVYLASRAGTMAVTQAVIQDLKDLDVLTFEARQKLATAKQHAATLRKGKEGDAAAAAAKPWDTVASNLNVAIESYTAFTTTLADEKGTLPLSAVLREDALARILASTGETFAIFPTYVVAGGGYYTQTNLWTVVIGVVPFHISGGSAVAYTVVRARDGMTLGGGTVEGESSYAKVKTVSARLREVKTYAKLDAGNCVATTAGWAAVVPAALAGE